MFHHVARAQPRFLLFRTHLEAASLWEGLASDFPEMSACCLMPDHVHLILPHADPERHLARVKSGYARWRNRHRGVDGAVWATGPAPEPLVDGDKIRRSERYVHLNPCRAGLVADPLAWPWSTHRDRTGLVVRGVVEPVRARERYHRWVSGDPTVAVEGTELPLPRPGAFGWQDVVDAVGNVARAPSLDFRERSTERACTIQVAWALRVASRAELAELARVSVATACRLAATAPSRYSGEGAVGACLRAVGDPRFGALHLGDLRRSPGWARYRGYN